MHSWYALIQKKWESIPPGLRKTIAAFSALFCIWLLLNVCFPLRVHVQYAPLLLDRNGELLHTRLTPDEQWRLPLKDADITPLMEKAILAKEDRWFYYHPGVNLLAVGRAFIQNMVLGRRVSGASTITMQVARMLNRKPRTVRSKLIEMFRALQLEYHFSKKEILRMYLNLAPYGGNVEGIASASWFYLGKAPDHLSLAEIIALSIIPNQPNRLTPGKHNAAIIQKRNAWLTRLGQQGYFSATAIEDALREPFDAYRRKPPRYAPHFSQKLLQQSGSEKHTTLLLQHQLLTEKIVQDYTRALLYQQIHQAAVMVVNNETMQVEAYVGSADFFDTTHAGQVNGAAAIRQPGSTLKPLVYALGIDAGKITPKTILQDVPVNYQGYVPENYDQQFNGLVSMEYALMHSLNIPAVNMLQEVGKAKMIHALELAQFRQITKDREKLGLSMILGGCGTSLEELTGLYAMLANNGMYQPVRFLLQDSSSMPARIISKEASFMLNEILSKSNRPDFPLHWQTTENMPRIAWKTGTSYGRRDAWSIGYNQHYTIGVWLGNFSGKGSADLSGASTATPLLFRLFNALDKNSHTGWYSPPPSVEQRLICIETGKVPNHFCNQQVLDYFIPLVSPVDVCAHKAEIAVSADEKISYCAECLPENGYKQKWYTNIPATVAAFQQQWLKTHESIPPHNSSCGRVWAGQGPHIKSPVHRASYLISKQHPEPLLLECAPAEDVTLVHWYINDRHFKTLPARTRAYFMPLAGPQKISCTDDKGRSRNIFIDVKMVDL